MNWNSAFSKLQTGLNNGRTIFVDAFRANAAGPNDDVESRAPLVTESGTGSRNTGSGNSGNSGNGSNSKHHHHGSSMHGGSSSSSSSSSSSTVAGASSTDNPGANFGNFAKFVLNKATTAGQKAKETMSTVRNVALPGSVAPAASPQPSVFTRAKRWGYGIVGCILLLMIGPSVLSLLTGTAKLVKQVGGTSSEGQHSIVDHVLCVCSIHADAGKDAALDQALMSFLAQGDGKASIKIFKTVQEGNQYAIQEARKTDDFGDSSIEMLRSIIEKHHGSWDAISGLIAATEVECDILAVQSTRKIKGKLEKNAVVDTKEEIGEDVTKKEDQQEATIAGKDPNQRITTENDASIP